VVDGLDFERGSLGSWKGLVGFFESMLMWGVMVGIYLFSVGKLEEKKEVG
jgi:hypothetical protein